MRATPLFAVGFVLAAGLTLHAQWLKLPTPGLPRLPDGKPNLEAPAPRTPDGKRDFSGLWSNDGGDRFYNNIAVDLQTSDVAPWAQALFVKRSLAFSKDSPETQCLPLGPAYLTTRYREFRIIQNHQKSRARMSLTKAARPVQVPAATLLLCRCLRYGRPVQLQEGHHRQR